MVEPQDMILPLLREMRAKLREGFEGIRARFDRQDARFDNLREAVNGESGLGRYAAAEVEERPEAVEKRLAELEARS